MNEITRNLWIGGLTSALNTQQLRENNIHSVLSVMRGKLKINEKTFIRHQIELDDTHEADVLSQFLPAVHFIGGELAKGRGVLVHCLAGISRSPTIVAAYLIYTLNITADEALGIILKQRPFVQPNSNFVRQLYLFHNSQGKVSRNDKDIRRFYLEGTVHQVMTSGDGSRLATEMLPSFPNPEVNTRSTAMATMATTTMPTSRRQRRIRCKMCRQDLATREHMLDHGQLGPSAEKPLDCQPQLDSSPSEHPSSGINPGCEREFGPDANAKPVSTISSALPISADASNVEDVKITTLSDSIRSLAVDQQSPTAITSPKGSSDLSSEIAAVHIRSPSPSGVPSEPSQEEPHLQQQQHIFPNPDSTQTSFINPKCSGYFVEPMKWMDHFLSAGSLAGKITCPNKKCNAKLGNYDWAGVCCGCKIWVTPGFCINRSKVDEVG